VHIYHTTSLFFGIPKNSNNEFSSCACRRRALAGSTEDHGYSQYDVLCIVNEASRNCMEEPAASCDMQRGPCWLCSDLAGPAAAPEQNLANPARHDSGPGLGSMRSADTRTCRHLGDGLVRRDMPCDSHTANGTRACILGWHVSL